MADDNYNIKLPDGSVVPVPGWAREVTLRVLVDQMKIGLDLNNRLIKEVQALNVDTDDLEDAIKQMFENLEDAKREETEEEKKSRVAFAKEVAKTTGDIVDRFSDTSKPLSSMVNNIQDLGKGISGGVTSIMRQRGVLDNISDKAQAFWGEASGLVGDALFAYAGFMAGQLEQFAEVQQSMINAGAIFYDASQGFDAIRDMAVNSGITYRQLGQIANEYGTTLQVLGMGVSGGVVAFTEQFRALNEFADDFGDFGMSNEQMANAFAEYIDVQRMVGSINNRSVQITDQLQTGFTELIMETTALAAMTGMNRNELLARQNAALRGPAVAASLIRLREAGFEDEAAAIEGIIRGFATIEGDIPAGVSEMVQTAISAAYTDAAERGDLSSVNLSAAMVAADTTDGVMSGILRQTGITQQLQTAIENGASPAELQELVIEQFATLEDRLPDIAMNTGASMSPYAEMIKQFRDSSTIMRQKYETFLNATDAERAQALADIRANLNVAGSPVVAVNELTRMFLQAQAAITADLDTSAEIARSVATGLQAMASFFNQTYEEDREDDAAPPSLSELMTPGSASDIDQWSLIAERLQYNDYDMSNVPSFGPEGRYSVQPYDEAILTRYQDGSIPNATVTQRFDPIYNTEVYVMEAPNQVPTIMLPDGYTGGQPVQRRYGGMVTPAQNSSGGYIVGEAGPEYFEPGQSGAVTSFQQLSAMLGERADILTQAADSFTQMMNVNFPDVLGNIMGNRESLDLVQQALTQLTKTTNQENENDVNIRNVEQLITDQFELLTSDLSEFGGAGLNVNDDLTNLNIGVDDTDARMGFDPRGQDQRGVTETSTPPVESNPEEIVSRVQEVVEQSVGNISSDLRNRIEEGIAGIVETKQNYAAAIRSLNQEIKRYRRLNQEGRTIR